MSTPLLLLVLFDGLGHQLFQNHYQNFSNLSKFYKGSPKVKQGMTPVFPSSTTPNLMSMATGLYVESHGLIDNEIFANPDELQKYNHATFSLFSDSDEDGTWWDNGLNLPIWTLNELSSSKENPRFSGGMFWSGAGVPYRDHHIQYYEAYNPHNSWHLEVDKVMEWFTDKNRPANCVFLYFDDPDITLHEYGAESQQFLNSLKNVDEALGYLLTKIEENNLKDDLNVILTADHGHVNVPVDHYNEIGKLNILGNYVEDLTSSIIWSVKPSPEDYGSVFDKLYHGSLTMNYSVWTKAEFPESAHYKNAPHVGSIIVLSDLGYRTVLSRYDNVTLGSTHGYNNTFPEMKAFFMAQGPAFNASAEIDSFNNVDLFPLMCSILDISPSPNNGSLRRISPILNNSYLNFRSSDSNRDTSSSNGSGVFDYSTAIAVTLILVLFIIGASFIFVRHMRRQKRVGTTQNYLTGKINGEYSFVDDSDEEDIL